MNEETKLFEMWQSKYEKVKLIKESERSSVFTVRRRTDGKRFLMRRIEGEAEIYKKLPGVSCENLPEIIEVFENKNETFIIEEFVPGETLFEILECGTFSDDEAVKCVSEVCKGLSVLHEHGIVHRDIKPENIMMNGEKTVLIDFDASRETAPEKTADTQILGTTGYASPEQYGLSQTDARSDIYSLGVVLNIMLTGEHPSTKLAEGTLGEIVQKCTMINPDMRFQSAEELEKALEKSEQPKKSIKKRIAAGIFAVIVVLGIAAGIPLFEKEDINDEIIASGFCGAENGGKNLEWKINSDYVLTISGKGKMADYNLYDETEEIVYPWKDYKDMLFGIVIEEGVSSIGKDAFHSMNISGGNLVLPESLAEIGTMAFCGNNFSGELVLPEGLKIIGDCAFQKAGDFTAAKIPSTVVKIYDTPFRYCGLEEIVVHSDNDYYCSYEGALFTEDMKEIIQFPEKITGTFTLPETVEIIGDGAFEKASLDEITIAGDIESVEGVAFQFYSGKVVFEGNVNEIKEGAFHNENGRTEVYFFGGAPENVSEKMSSEWYSFMGNTEIFYLIGTSGWETDSNGLWNGYEITGIEDKKQTEYIVITDIGPAEGKSLRFPPDFYDYWSAKEIITENIKISAPGNLENYINYKFSGDVLTLTLGVIPEEEWKIALEEIPESEDMVMISIILEAPSKDVCKIATHHGNGPTYSNLKKQEQSGTEIHYDNFNAFMDYDWTGQEIATIIYEDGKKSVAPVEHESIFYKIVYWQTYDGEIIRQILPYEIVIGEDCFAYSFEDENSVKTEPEEYNTEWLDYYWNPVEDPERVVLKTVSEGRKETEISIFEENGLFVNIFEKPGFINVSVENPEELDPKLMANSEILILPPDSRPRKEGESLEEWLENVYSKTKYAGCKITAGGTGYNENPKEAADFQAEIVNAGYFYDVRNRTICVSNLFPLNSAKTKDGTLWYTLNYGQATFLIMDWYLENLEENPNAKPETREYIYHDCENIAIIR